MGITKGDLIPTEIAFVEGLGPDKSIRPKTRSGQVRSGYHDPVIDILDLNGTSLEYYSNLNFIKKIPDPDHSNRFNSIPSKERLEYPFIDREGKDHPTMADVDIANSEINAGRYKKNEAPQIEFHTPLQKSRNIFKKSKDGKPY